MPVKGADKLKAAFRRMPDAVREDVEEAIQRAADLILEDMKRFVPRDTGDLAAALAKVATESGLGALIGLPTQELANDYFYARFIEEGTKGGTVNYRRKGGPQVHTMNVPARPATPFMAPALDVNREDIERLLRTAIQTGINRAT